MSRRHRTGWSCPTPRESATATPGPFRKPSPSPPTCPPPPPPSTPPPPPPPPRPPPRAPPPPPPPPPPAPPPPPPPPPAGATGAPPAAPSAVPTASAGIGGAQVLITPPGPLLRVGGGPYTVPISITEATRISTITLTMIYDPTKLRVRTVQEGSFMRAGGVNVAFSQQANGNRIDITLARGADATGASGTGLVAAILFDAIAPGSATFTLSGAATGPGGTAMGLRFSPVTVNVQ